MKDHFLIFLDERPFSCETCGKAFKQMPHLRTHIDIMHKGNKAKYYAKLKVMCGTCGKVLNSKKSLQAWLLLLVSFALIVNFYLMKSKNF